MKLREGTIVDATIIAAPSSTKDRSWQRDPEMRQVKKGNQHYFGMKLREGTIVDATIIAAPSSTKNRSWQRHPEMRQVKKGNQHYFGMKLHIGVDAETGLVHTMRSTSANVHDVTEAHWLLHGGEKRVWGDAGYVGVQKREENRELAVEWQVALKAGQRRKLEPGSLDAYAERVKASIRAKVEHPFRDVKGLFGYAKSLPSRKRGCATEVWSRTRSGWPYCWDPTCGGPAASWPADLGSSAPSEGG